MGDQSIISVQLNKEGKGMDEMEEGWMARERGYLMEVARAKVRKAIFE